VENPIFLQNNSTVKRYTKPTENKGLINLLE